MSDVSSAEQWAAVKGQFYADALPLGMSALSALKQKDITLPEEYLDRQPHRPFYVLESVLKNAVMDAYSEETAELQTDGCPYHETLDAKLGRRRLPEDLDISEDRRTFIETALPGGFEASVLIANLISRMQAAAAVHNVDIAPAELARNSSGLIREPLRHPQQWAKAFLFTLVPKEGVMTLGGDAFSFDRPQFLTDELLERYTRVTDEQKPKVEWSMPVADFVINAPQILVHSRTYGSERVIDEATRTYYAGIRLGDIEVDEPTFTCPGKPMAYYLWGEATRLAEQHDLWNRAAKSA